MRTAPSSMGGGSIPASEPFWLGPVVAVGAMACGVAEPSGCATSVIDGPPADLRSARTLWSGRATHWQHRVR